MSAWLAGRRALAHLAFGVALLAKEQAVVVPQQFALAVLCRLTPGAPALRLAAWRDWLARYALSAAMIAFYLAARSALFAGGEWRLAVFEDPAGPPLSLLFALQTGFAPFAALVYEPELATWWSPARLLAALFALAALAWLSRRTAAPPARVTLFWIGWFVLAQLPTANWLRQEARFDERYAFLALLALPAFAACLVAPLWVSARSRRVVATASAAVVLGLVALTAGRAAAFRDDAAFAAAWLRSAPDSAEAHHLLGATAAARGDLEVAIRHYRRALPGVPESADLHANLGAALAATGRESEGLASLETALRIDPGHPEALVNAGILWERRGQLEEAVAAWRAALRSDPSRAVAHARLGAALLARGDVDEARRHLREALRLDPSDTRSRHLLGISEADSAP
jgi:tetratricopeptide (TPR) repeat protein